MPMQSHFREYFPMRSRHELVAPMNTLLIVLGGTLVVPATSLALLVPSVAGRLLFGEELTGVAIPVARVTGIALIGLGIACWPGPPAVALLSYSAVLTLYLAYVGLAGELTGILLWPVVVVHVILTALLAWAQTSDKATKT